MTLLVTHPGCNEIVREAREISEILSSRSPLGLRAVRITSNGQFDQGGIYPESPVFTPDSSRFILQRMLHNPPVISMERRWHQYWLCDIDDDFAQRLLTPEDTATAPCVSPDGRWMYYFLNNRNPADHVGVSLMRVCLQTFQRELVMKLDKPLSDSPAPPSRLYSLATIRADGSAVATGAYLGDGVRPGNWGVIVCDLAKHEARVAIASPQYVNPHMQYARTSDPAHMHDLLVQENVGVITQPNGDCVLTGSGCRVHVIRDDGTNFRTVPCGNDKLEKCHGHQEWRGCLPTVVVGVDVVEPDGRLTRPLIEAVAIPADPDDDTPPRLRAGAENARNVITRDMPSPAFGHTAFDRTGTRFVGDNLQVGRPTTETEILIGTLGTTPGAALQTRFLLNTQSTYHADQATHPHPYLSPGGSRVFFNSDFGSPTMQLWMVEGFSNQD